MKKILMVAAAAAALSAMPASAQTLTYGLTAQVASVCGVYRSSGQTVAVDFGQLAATPAGVALPEVGAGSASYRCNSATGFTRTISSANSGFLVRNGVATTDPLNRIPFNIRHGGGSGLGFAAQQLTGPINTSFGGSGAFLAGQTGSVLFTTFGVDAGPSANNNNAPGTTVFAGNYQDTVTITVTAN